ncbi:MAG: type IV secretion system protein [Thermaurantiacus sp.]
MKRLLLTTALCLGFASTTQAQGVPTIDTRAITQQIQQFQQMLEDFGMQTDIFDTLTAQLEVVQNQLTELQRTYAALTEIGDLVELAMGGDLDRLLTSGFGDLLGLVRNIQTGNWEDLLGPGGLQLRTQMEGALAAAGFDEDTIRQMATSGNAGAERTAAQATTGAMAAAAGQTSHENAAHAGTRLETLVEAIGDQETLRQSLDHNTRVTAELGIILLQMLELQAVQTVARGQVGILDAATIAEEQRYLDLTLPDLR